MVHTLARLLALGLLFGSAMAEAALGNCSSNFPDGLQSPFSGTAASKGVITFAYNSQLLNNPDSVLAAKSVVRDTASSVLTCTSANCTASGTAAAIQTAPGFPTTGSFTTVLDVPYNTSQSLAGNGSNQYKQINVSTQSQLNINGGGQGFYIEQLTLASSSILRLSPGDYWIGSLTTGYQTQIQLQGTGQVRLFVRDDWALSASALLNSPGINSAGTANNLYVYSYGSVTLGNLATFSGYLYSAASNGSNAAIALASPSYAFGALSAENIRLDTASQVTYVAPTGSCSDLRLSWSMSEASWSGTASEIRDTSGNALHGRAYNGATTAISTPALPADSGGFGTCRYGQLQSSSSQYAQVADSSLLDLTASFTVALWVRPSSRPASGLMTIVSKDTNFEFHQRSSGVINWWWNSSTGATQQFDSTAALPLDTWTHVVIRYASGDQRIYLNGVQSGSATFTGGLANNNLPLQLGQDQGVAGRYFNGALDELRVYQGALSNGEILALAQQRPSYCASTPVLDHYRLEFTSSTALTCNPLSVTLKACQNSSCSSLYSGSVTATLSPASGWTAGNSVNFSGGSSTQAFRLTTPGSATLGISGSPAASNASVCVVAGSPGSCTVTFADSGFLLNVPNMLAHKGTSATIQAIKKDDSSQKCVPGFAKVTRSIAFTSSYSNPGSGTKQVQVGGSDTPASLNLDFDAYGEASFQVNYDDAGSMLLNASYTGSTTNGDNGLSMQGSTSFVSKPYGLCLQTASTLSASTTCSDASCALFPGGIRAGDSFPLTIRAVAWEADNEAATAAQLCSGNLVTPNFQLAGITLGSSVLAPSPGTSDVLTPTNYSHAQGTQTSPSVAVSEVGVFTLSATPPAAGYFGETVAGGSSGPVGRFIPAYLDAAGSASLTPSCGGTFSYQGQPIGFATSKPPTLTVTAYNRSGQVTGNYDRGAFWKLAAPAVGGYSSITGLTALDARLSSTGTATQSVSGADNGDGARTYSWTGEQLLYQAPTVPSSDDYPFTAKIRQTFPDTSLKETDLGQAVCYGTGSGCLAYSYDFSDEPGSAVRLGRLRIGNAHGSELQSLTLPVALESWQNLAGGSFQKEGLDTCTTAAVLGAPVLNGYLGNLAAGETTPTSTAPSGGAGSLLLSAPGSGNDGSVQAGYSTLPSWLYFAWDGVTRSSARGLATFGIYKGATPLIFRRELYR